MESRADVVRVKCAGCRSTIKAAPKYQGKTVRCPRCDHHVKIPLARAVGRGTRGAPSAGTQQEFLEGELIEEGAEAATFLDDDMFEEDFGQYDDDLDDFAAPPRRGKKTASKSESSFDDVFGNMRATSADDELDEFDDYDALPPRRGRDAGTRSRPRQAGPRRRKKRKKSSSDNGGAFGFEKGVVNAGVLGGTLAMVGAVVWFVLGLMNDILFFYPPVLFIVGLVAFFKGLVGGD